MNKDERAGVARIIRFFEICRDEGLEFAVALRLAVAAFGALGGER